jgi:hypothetical protein
MPGRLCAPDSNCFKNPSVAVVPVDCVTYLKALTKLGFLVQYSIAQIEYVSGLEIPACLLTLRMASVSCAL